jgi:hypothetical protein
MNSERLIVDRPIDARTDEQICKLPRDNFPASSCKWTAFIFGNEHIFLSAPHGKGGVEIPREQFDVICKWYMGVVP